MAWSKRRAGKNGIDTFKTRMKSKWHVYVLKQTILFQSCLVFYFLRVIHSFTTIVAVSTYYYNTYCTHTCHVFRSTPPVPMTKYNLEEFKPVQYEAVFLNRPYLDHLCKYGVYIFIISSQLLLSDSLRYTRALLSCMQVDNTCLPKHTLSEPPL